MPQGLGPGSAPTEPPSPVAVRPVQEGDRPRIEQFSRGLSYGTRYFRFGEGRMAFRASDLDRMFSDAREQPLRLVAVSGSGGAEQVVGLARLFVDPEWRSAELALTVADDWQGRGVGGRLLDHLVGAARAAGLIRIEALVLSTNARMLRLLASAGFRIDLPTAGSSLRLARLQLRD